MPFADLRSFTKFSESKLPYDVVFALEHLNHQLRHDLDQPLRMGIGIHAGPAIVGEMGYLAETTITAIGDNINTALRLETITKEFTMQAVISAQGGERAGADLSAFEIRQVTVRGRSEPMAVHLIPDARSLAAARCPNNGANGSA